MVFYSGKEMVGRLCTHSEHLSQRKCALGCPQSHLNSVSGNLADYPRENSKRRKIGFAASLRMDSFGNEPRTERNSGSLSVVYYHLKREKKHRSFSKR